MPANRILLLASAGDPASEVFPARHRGLQVTLMTPADLSVAGWIHRSTDARGALCVADSAVVPVNEIAGVITRLPGVSENDLPHIVAADRVYLAAEMTAFLLAWLSALRCPVLNRPTPFCLSGPYLRREQMVYLVARLGVPVGGLECSIGHGVEAQPESVGARHRVVIVGEHHLGRVHPLLLRYARRIARALQVDFLAVDFSGNDEHARFVDLSLWPEIDETLARLLLDQLSTSIARSGAGEESICA